MPYIQLDKEIVTGWIGQDLQFLRAWIEILMKERYGCERGPEPDFGVILEPGEFIFGRKAWSHRLGISEQRIRIFMDKLVAEGRIEKVRATNKFTIFRVNQRTTSNPTNGQPTDNQQEPAPGLGSWLPGNQPTTNGEPTENQRTTTKEEVIKKNQEKKKEDQNHPGDHPAAAPKSGTRTRRTYEPESVEYLLAERLLERIKKHYEEFKPPDLQRWADDLRLAIEKDGRSVEDLEGLIDWSTGHHFWRKNILSAAKLRDKFDTLKIDMTSKGGKGGGDADGKPGTDRRGRDPERLDQKESRTFSL